MTDSPLYIYGAGGLGQEVFSAFHESYNVVAFVEDDEYFSPREIFNVDVTPFSKFKKDCLPQSNVVMAFGHVKGKASKRKEIEGICNLITLIHPTASIGVNVEIGVGSLIMNNCILTCDVQIGDCVCIDRASNISHGCKIGSYSHICPMVSISGDVTMGECCYIGTGSSIREKTNVASSTFLGMGGVLVKSIEEENRVYVGVPAREVRAQ
jgi:sugar O-acyltransferase (sialic acid O-acetyltransferase NeuD family)